MDSPRQAARSEPNKAVRGQGPAFRAVESFDRFILIAIKPPHSDQIFRGRKKLEFRRRNVAFPENRTLAFVYESRPTSSIVGAFAVGRVYREQLDVLWEIVFRTMQYSKTQFCAYFSGSSHGTAIEIRDLYRLDPPCSSDDLKSADSSFGVPQSYRYVEREFIETLEALGSTVLPSPS